MSHKRLNWENKSINPADYFEMVRTGKDDILLESAREGVTGRYSYIALNPKTIFKAKGENIWINGKYAKGKPFDIFRETFDKECPKSMKKPKDVPLFYAGAIGYLGYDLKNSLEPKLKTSATDDAGFWDMYMVFPQQIISFDHQNEEIHLFSEDDSQIARLKKMIQECRVNPTNENRPDSTKTNPEIHTNLSFGQYLPLFDKAMAYVRDGHTYQVKLSIRHELDINEDSFEIYKRLRKINPSPYASYLDLESICLVGCSPEELLKVEGRIAQTRPIGGTYRRGKNTVEDEAIAKEFFKDPKEVAEHVMLIDLERNDLGRVCKLGSVRVTDRMALEKYSHLMHIVTTINGELSDHKTSFDLVRSMFPGGTVTGCPKIRTMEIIDELEPVARGPYTGSVGFFTPNDESQFNIIIRTLAINKKTNKGYIQVGGGIVEASNAEYEYEEDLKKGRALVEAVLANK